MSGDATTKLCSEALAMVSWGGDATLSLMPGGATGMTYLLTHTDGRKAIVRRTGVNGLYGKWSDLSQHAVENAVADAGLGAKVLAGNDTMLVCEFLEGHKTLSVGDVLLPSDAADAAAAPTNAAATLDAVAQATARLHALPMSLAPPAGDELRKWHGYAVDALEAFKAGLPADDAATRTAVDTAVDGIGALLPLVDQVSSYAAPAERLGIFDRFPPDVVTTHGDLHLGNVLAPPEGPVKFVDLDRVAPRDAATDIAYFFRVWGDHIYMTPAYGFAPTAAKPEPYPSLAARRAFCVAYLAARRGVAADAVPACDVDALLLKVEVYVVAERFRLLCIISLMVSQNAAMLSMGVLPMTATVRTACTILEELSIATGGVDNVGDVCAAVKARCDIVEVGVCVAAAARNLAAAAAQSK